MRIASLFVLAGLGLSSQAFAAPTLTLSADATCGGEITVSVTDSLNYRLVFGDATDPDDPYTVPEGHCAGTVLDIDGSASAILSEPDTTFVLPNRYCGKLAQVIHIEAGACEVSDPVTLPTESAYDVGYEGGCEDAGGEWDVATGTCFAAVCDETTNDAAIEQALCESAAVGGTWNASDGSCTAATCARSG